MNQDRSWGPPMVVAAAIGVLIWVTYLVLSWPPEPPGSASGSSDRPPQDAPAAVESDPVSDEPGGSADEAPAGGAPVVVVVGDSFTSGSAENSGPEWSTMLGDRLGWKVDAAAVPGSGYVSGGDAAFGERLDAVVDADPDLVLLAGGINDVRFDPDEVAAAAEDVLGRLRDALPEAQILMLSPFSNGDPGPMTNALTERLRESAKSFEVPYLDVTEYLPYGEDLIGDDGLHPTDKGQRRIAVRLAQDLREADLVTP